MGLYEVPCCCCLPSPMTLATGGSAMFPLVVHQPAVQSLRQGLSTNPGGDNMVRMRYPCVCLCWVFGPDKLV